MPTIATTKPLVDLPAEILPVFSDFLSCEFATLGQGGVPIAWPTLPVYWPETGQFVIASPVALSQKAANVRRNPHVSLLFSNPTGSGLQTPPAVLVQGDAVAPPEIIQSYAQLDPGLLRAFAAQGRKLFRLQPAMRLYLANGLTRSIMEWYFIRVIITITPRRITWWERGDFSRPPSLLEVPYVAAN